METKGSREYVLNMVYVSEAGGRVGKGTENKDGTNSEWDELRKDVHQDRVGDRSEEVEDEYACYADGAHLGVGKTQHCSRANSDECCRWRWRGSWKAPISTRKQELRLSAQRHHARLAPIAVCLGLRHFRS